MLAWEDETAVVLELAEGSVLKDMLAEVAEGAVLAGNAGGSVVAVGRVAAGVVVVMMEGVVDRVVGDVKAGIWVLSAGPGCDDSTSLSAPPLNNIFSIFFNLC